MANNKVRISYIRLGLRRKYGLDMTDHRIRRYEKMGLFNSGRCKSNDYREWTPDEAAQVEETLLLLELGVPIKVLQVNDKGLIAERIKAVEAALNEVKKRRT